MREARKKCAKAAEKPERILELNRISIVEGIERRESGAAQNAEEDHPRREGAASSDKPSQPAKPKKLREDRKKCAKATEKPERILKLNRISVIEGIERRGSDAAQDAEEDHPRGEGTARADKLYQRRHKDLNAFSP